MEKTCGNCGNATDRAFSCGEEPGVGCYKHGEFMCTHDSCDGWVEQTDTLEQRYAQLKQVAREMFGELTTEWLSLDDIKRYHDQLEALGVVCDD